MDRSDVITLISLTKSQDDYGVWRENEARHDVFCNVGSVTRAEFFDGGRNGLNPAYVFTMFFGDYNGERIVEYKGERFSIYRTYHAKTDTIELYAERKVAQMARRRKGRISALDLSDAINEILKEYGVAAGTALYKGVKEVTAEAADKLTQVERFAPKGHPTGDYSKDWDYSFREDGRFALRGTVYNGSHYRLTHLLEFGHVTRNGTGRTFDRTPAYPHIAKVNDWAHDELIRNVKKRLEDIG